MNKPTIIIHIENGVVNGVGLTADADIVVVDTGSEGSDCVKTCPADLPWCELHHDKADIFNVTGDPVIEEVAAKFRRAAKRIRHDRET